MLDMLRRGAAGWVAKIFLGLLVISFAIWGIGDVFRGATGTAVARVGDAEITVDAYRTSFNNELRRLGQQFGRVLPVADARALGIDQQVLGQLLAEATLNARAEELGLGLSDEAIARSITDDPLFRGPDGRFDARRFQELLRAGDLNEAGFVQAQRAFLLRRQIVEGLTGGVEAPSVLQRAAHRHQTETRSIAYVVLSAAGAGEIAPADEQTLRTFYDERRSSFRAPERRTLAALALTPQALAAAETVAEADIAARYEQNRARYARPERRTVQRIAFASAEAARQAHAEIAGGADFESVARARGRADVAIDLGTVTREAIVDPAVAEAAFALPVGEASQPIEGGFAPALVRVNAIEPATTQALDEVRETIRREIAAERSRDKLLDLHDQVEDARAGGATLAEIAQRFGLELRTLEGVERQGRLANGEQADVPEIARVLAEAFQSDVGVENDPVQTGDNGFVWFEVTRVDPARERSFEDARGDVLARWRAEEVRRRLDAKAAELVKALQDGQATLPDIALREALELQTADGIGRAGGTPLLDRAGLAQVFAAPVEGFGSASTANGEDRLVFQVSGSNVPAYDPNGPDAQRLAEQLGGDLASDLATEYVQRAQSELGVTINRQALATALGQPSDN